MMFIDAESTMAETDCDVFPTNLKPGRALELLDAHSSAAGHEVPECTVRHAAMLVLVENASELDITRARAAVRAKWGR